MSVRVLDAAKGNSLRGGPSFSLGNRLLRLTWNVVWLLLAGWTPTPFRLWRVFLLRSFGADVDWTANVYSSARIWFPKNLKMGKEACLGPNSNCYCMDLVTLEDGVIVSQDAQLCAGSHDIEDVNFQLFTRPITIGRKAWIAAGAFVGPGVTVGEFAVVGARAVVFKSVEDSSIVVGNPAKVIRTRQLGGER